MALLKARDADSTTKYLKASGDGSDTAPFVVEHSDSATLAQVQTLTTATASIYDLVSQLQTILDNSRSYLMNIRDSGVSVNTKTLDAATTQANFDSVRTALNNILTDSLKKANLADTQPVSFTSAPLPSGAATDAKLATLSTQIDALTTKVNQIQTIVSSTMAVSAAINNYPATQQVGGTVAVSNFPASQSISGSIAVNNLPSIQAITDSQASYSDAQTPLAAGGTVTCSARDSITKNSVRGWCFTNVNGTLYVEQSRDNNTWRRTDVIAITGNATIASTFFFRLNARYYRLAYANGNTAQTTFELISTAFGIGL